MLKTIQTPSISRHRNEATVPKLRNTIADVSWRKEEKEEEKEKEDMRESIKSQKFQMIN